MNKVKAAEPKPENSAPHAVILILNQNSGKSGVQAGMGNRQSITENAKEALDGRMNQGSSGKNEAKTVSAANQDNNANSIVVQYNPKSIQYSASAQDTQTSAAAGTGGPNAITAGCSITMSIELLFFNQGSEDDSVRTQMDKLLTLMSASKDRQVRFSWSAMVIEGAVTSFSSSYDMFDKTGKPISAKVNMSIRCHLGVEDKQYTRLTKDRSNKKTV